MSPMYEAKKRGSVWIVTKDGPFIVARFYSDEAEENAKHFAWHKNKPERADDD